MRFSSPFVVGLRISETLQTGAVRKTKLPFYRLVGAVSNCACRVDESVYLFFEFTIVQSIPTICPR